MMGTGRRYVVNPIVNPNHLILGTHAENMQDMQDRGRRANKKGCRGKPQKLCAELVLEIRRDYAAGISSQRALARKYSVSSPLICGIISRKHWSHI